MPMSVVFPKANLERTSGEISKWSVSAGDKVSVGDILFEVEDDKAVVEVDSPADGYIGMLAEAGEEIDVGEVVATIYDSIDELEAAKGAAKPAPVAPEVPAQGADTTPIVAVTAANDVPASSGRVKSTPLARRIAKDNGVSIDGLKGTGPNGRIQKKDVLASLETKPAVEVPGPAVPVDTVSIVSPAATRLNTLWYQKGEGTPVAFIHGFGADVSAWGGLLSGARYDFPALAVDLPCHGKSGTHLPADLDGIAAEIEATLQAEGVTDLTIAAHSFGGAVAARMATRGVLRIRAMCLFAPAGLSPDINAGFVSAMLRARSKEALKPWLMQMVDDPSLINDLLLERAMATRATDEAFGALQRFGHQFFPDGSQRFNTLHDLSAYLGPLRVIFGRQDRILPVEATRNLPGNAALHLWDRCGHTPHFEHRRDALRVLEEVRRSA